MSREITIYLAGGMGKFGKEGFKKSNSWRVFIERKLTNNDCGMEVYCVNPNDYFNFVDEPPRYAS